MKALFCTWLDICVSESARCVHDATAGAVLLNVNFVHRLESKLVLDPLKSKWSDHVFLICSWIGP